MLTLNKNKNRLFQKILFDADAALEEELGLQENDTEMLQAAAEEETDTNNPENSETADKQTQAEESTRKMLQKMLPRNRKNK